MEVKQNIGTKWDNSLTTNVPHYIEPSQLICSANQLTGFYMMGNAHRYWVKQARFITYYMYSICCACHLIIVM